MMETQQQPPPPPCRIADVNDKLSEKKPSQSRTPLKDVTNSASKTGNATAKTEYIVDKDNTRYIRGKILGKGGFATVILVTTDDYKRQEFAAKIINKMRILKPEKKDKITREIDIHRKMFHVNVVRFVKFFEDAESVYLLMENCGGMTLSKILKARATITECEVRYYLRQLLEGCEYIHSRGVVHRDLKLSNLFITESMRLKIGDFGLSAYISSDSDKKESICGTPNYISPEVIQKIGHSFPADVWAIGCIVYALLSGRPPFETDCLKHTYKLISRCKYNDPSKASTNARYFIAQCLRVEPKLRPSLRQLKDDEFLKGTAPETLTMSEAMRGLPGTKDDTNTNKHVERNKNNMPIGTMQYFIDTIDKLETCAQGGKTFADCPSSANACAELLSALYVTLNQIKGCDRKLNPVALTDDNFIWITKWVDYSHKYGFGFQLSNDLYGASFKDGFSMSINGEESHVGIQDAEDKVSVCCPIYQLSEEHDKQLQVMRYFVKYMDDTLIKGGDAKDPHSKVLSLKDTFMLHWLRTKDSILMCLSTGTVQVNWLADHTKLAIERAGEGYRIMYINKKRQSFICKLSDIARHGVTSEVKLRLRYIALMLAKVFEQEGVDVLKGAEM